MKRRHLVVLALLASARALAQSPEAAAELDQALARQRTLPFYTEHVLGRFPPLPGADLMQKMIADRLKERATDFVQKKIGLATAKAPIAGMLADRAMNEMTEKANNGEDLGFQIDWPERELIVIEHARGRQRQVSALLGTEVVRVDGRMAVRYDLAPQIAQLAVTAATVGEQAYGDVRSVRASVRSLASGAAQGGFALVGAAADLLTSATQLLETASTSAQILQSAAGLARVSGKWQCRADTPVIDAEIGARIAVTRLADEAADGEPAHVYAESRAPGGTRDPSRLETRFWVRTSDGLPARRELELPAGLSQRAEFDYVTPVEIVFPRCDFN